MRNGRSQHTAAHDPEPTKEQAGRQVERKEPMP